MKTRGSFALLDSLVRNGTRHIFGYPGGAILPIYDEVYKWEEKNLIKHILVRHEQGAVHAADGYARATSKVGVCFATSGPGATNLVTGIATAQMDSVPLVMITGQVGRPFIGTDAFQETDIFGITLPIVKHSYVIRDVKKIAHIVSEAFFIARNGRPGPVLIDVPKDVGLEEFTDYRPINQNNIIRSKGFRFIYRSTIKRLDQVIHLIEQASQPLFYVGGGVVTANANNELHKLAEHYQIPVTTTLMGKGAFNENDNLALGMLGMHGTAYANFSVSECDLLIAVGARFDDRVTGKLDEFAVNAQIIHIDIDPAEVGKNKTPHLSLIGDVKKILGELIKIAKKQNISTSDQTFAWRERIKKWQTVYPLVIPQGETKVSPQEILNNLTELAPNAFFTTDVGQHQMWSAQFLKCGVRKWSSSAGLGTMGYGIPAAIGNQVAFPKNTVICITGDASIQMNIQELGTIAQYQLPVKIILLNNNWQGMVRQWQQSFYGERYSHSSMNEGMPNFVQLANAYGINAKQISSPNNLKEQLQEVLDTPGPCLVDCQIIKDENCYPMVAPGKSNSQMIGISKQSTPVT
jgi:acetolactate synthase-1/2/3 large subunit|uniref:Acetolactate synthase n=2 Tax=Pelagomonas TaxID=35676 RepID=J9QSX6_9STRA|nr:acetolactate synthase large subunit [uncultured Pelagomonas]|tara:strand:- start:6753 stop:8483 length:1731 start_codon:yes stop_codon:yes gene_type:complete